EPLCQGGAFILIGIYIHRKRGQETPINQAREFGLGHREMSPASRVLLSRAATLSASWRRRAARSLVSRPSNIVTLRVSASCRRLLSLAANVSRKAPSLPPRTDIRRPTFLP